MTYKVKKITVYAIRDSETKERLSYRHRDRHKAANLLSIIGHNTGRPVEIYRTSQDLVTMRG